jgi:plastocyanin
MTDAMHRSWACPKAYIVAPLAALALASGTFGMAALAAGPAPNLRGRLMGWEKLLPQVYIEAAKSDSHRYTWREPSPTVKQDFRRLSANVSRDVCVAAFATGPAPPHEPLVVKITGGRATPSTVIVSPGSRVSFKNVDPFVHVLFEATGTEWVANPVAPGSSREWSTTAPGLHVIRDQLFPSVAMYVFVDPAALEFSLPDREGNFGMTLPHGDYTLKAFFDGKQVGKESVHVGPGGLEMKEPMALGGGDSK